MPKCPLLAPSTLATGRIDVLYANAEIAKLGSVAADPGEALRQSRGSRYGGGIPRLRRCLLHHRRRARCRMVVALICIRHEMSTRCKSTL